MILLEMLSYPFLVRAFLVGVLVSLCAALLGTSLVLKRYSMIGDGLSHVGFGALAIASALGVAPLAVAVPVVVVAAVLLLRVSQSGRVRGDAAIALISSGALAVGVLVISLTSRGEHQRLKLHVRQHPHHLEPRTRCSASSSAPRCSWCSRSSNPAHLARTHLTRPLPAPRARRRRATTCSSPYSRPSPSCSACA